MCESYLDPNSTGKKIGDNCGNLSTNWIFDDTKNFLIFSL